MTTEPGRAARELTRLVRQLSEELASNCRSRRSEDKLEAAVQMLRKLVRQAERERKSLDPSG